MTKIFWPNTTNVHQTCTRDTSVIKFWTNCTTNNSFTLDRSFSNPKSVSRHHLGSHHWLPRWQSVLLAARKWWNCDHQWYIPARGQHSLPSALVLGIFLFLSLSLFARKVKVVKLRNFDHNVLAPEPKFTQCFCLCLFHFSYRKWFIQEWTN